MEGCCCCLLLLLLLLPVGGGGCLRVPRLVWVAGGKCCDWDTKGERAGVPRLFSRSKPLRG
jgi:hypothetical protein